MITIYQINIKCLSKHVDKVTIKDTRSVSLYPYNRSQTLQYVKYTKWINISKDIAKFCDKYYVFGNKTNKQNTTKLKIKKPCRSQELNPGHLAPKNGCVTSAPLSQRIDCSQDIRLLARHFQRIHFFSVIFLHA